VTVDETKLPPDVRFQELEARVSALERSRRKSLEDMEARVKQLESMVADLRKAIAPPAGPKFHESGTIHPELDDQTIAP
jgi:hypothetical protein